MTPFVTTVPPVKLTFLSEQGRLGGSNLRYEKRLSDLAGLYRNAAAYEEMLRDDDDEPVYWVESSHTEDGPGGLITGISVLEPGMVGDEFFMTRGHLHAVSDRSELYMGLSGQGLMLLETVAGESKVVRIQPGQAVYVPGNWVHRSVNVGAERLVTMFCYAADAGQDYSIIERAGGMKSLVVLKDGRWVVKPNPDHHGYQV